MNAARFWFAKAADAGAADAQVALAEMMVNGRGGRAILPAPESYSRKLNAIAEPCSRSARCDYRLLITDY
jgi:TPR repeat protein